MPEKLTIPLAIVIAGLIIGGAVYLSHKGGSTIIRQVGDLATSSSQSQGIRPISSDDHILGNPGAQVIILEYSDTECPYCKMFHSTMQRIMNEYGASGKVAWVYRHFPIAELHPKSPKEAEATECVNELGGTSKFWQYLDSIYNETPSNNGLDPAELPRLATQIGINEKDFTACLSSGKYSAKVQADYNDAIGAGAQGTPYSFIITKDGTKTPVVGAQSYEDLKATLDAILQ